jgi:hypothetical protein
LSIAGSSRSDQRPVEAGRLADFGALILALPVFVLAELPIAGYVAGGGAWILQRTVQLALQRRVASANDPRTIVGITAASMIARSWLVALAIFLVGLSDRDAGLAAAVLVIFLFTIYLAMQFALRPFDGKELRP